jgi:hypothetical protein
MGAIYVSNCTTTINGGNITADYRGIDKQNGGTLTVNTGATIICENSAYVANKFDWGSAAISSGNIWSDTSDSGNIYIKGGTIASLATSHTGICGILVCTSVTNLYIGVDDSSIDTSNPHIIGYTYAIWNRSSKSKIYWYDGLLGQSYGSSNSYVNTTTNFNYSSSLTTVKGSSVYTYNSTQYYGYGWSLKSRY